MHTVIVVIGEQPDLCFSLLTECDSVEQAIAEIRKHVTPETRLEGAIVTPEKISTIAA